MQEMVVLFRLMVQRLLEWEIMIFWENMVVDLVLECIDMLPAARLPPFHAQAFGQDGLDHHNRREDRHKPQSSDLDQA